MYNSPYSTTVANLSMNNYSNQFLAWFQDGRIFSTNANGQPQEIGVSLDAFRELETTAAGYRDRLIELGEIEVPLTQEQINEKLLSELKEERAAREKLMSLIDKLTGAPQEVKEVSNESEKHAVGGVLASE